VAPVTLVFFLNLDSYRARVDGDTIRRVMARHAGKVRLFVRHVPTASAGQQAAWYLAQLEQRSPAQFWRAYDALLQVVGYRLPPREEVLRLLGAQGIDVKGLMPERAPGPALDRLEADRAQARLLQIDGTPALLVNGLLLRGSLSADTLESVIRRELETGLLERLLRRE
jgi:protein-disulfide isomerase